ncbi:MAG: phytanoyl-CoA dioxygenase family protein [Deltaproteobacteria bacterium]|nr:phytanoyl-CoA dioxygenase family protein [Deltaproteobacteria bacterium]
MDGLEILTPRPFDDASALLDDPPALRRVAGARGYLFLPGLLDPRRVRSLRRGALAACAALGLVGARGRAWPGVRLVPNDSPAWLELQARVAPRPAFQALARDRRLMAVLAALFDADPAGGRGDVCRVFLPGAPEHTTPPHQDYFFLRANGFAASDRTWAAWIPLGDCPRAVGGLAVIPGSHRDGLLPHVARDRRGPEVAVPADACWASSPMRAGDVVLVDCFTIHCGLPNATRDRVRLSVDFRYQPSTGAEAHRSGPRAASPGDGSFRGSTGRS